MLNPYQKIIKDGKIIQAGEMDTPTKFKQLTQGIDLTGKTVLDVGCNLGMICYLAAQAGAIPEGIDLNRDYVDQAKEIFPEIKFNCWTAEKMFGNYDIIIASAMLHYVKDLDEVFRNFARCGKKVLCDIWLNDSLDPVFELTHRGIYVPSKAAFYNIAGKYFNIIEEKGPAISPDISKRYVFHLSEPKPNQAEAILLYGEGNTGKTTLAQTYFGYTHLMTDNIFNTWKIENLPLSFSVAWFASLARGNYKTEYVNYFVNMLNEWLGSCVNRDIVVEGYDLVFDDFRNRVIKLLDGWKITEIKRTKTYEKEVKK